MLLPSVMPPHVERYPDRVPPHEDAQTAAGGLVEGSVFVVFQINVVRPEEAPPDEEPGVSHRYRLLGTQVLSLHVVVRRRRLRGLLGILGVFLSVSNDFGFFFLLFVCLLSWIS